MSILSVASVSSFAADFTLKNPTLVRMTQNTSFLSQLHTFNFEGDTQRTNLKGNIIVDLDKKMIQLNVVSKRAHCPRSAMCLQIVGPVSTAVISAKVSLTETHSNRCGEVSYVGQVDLRANGGMFEKVTVVDRSQSVCGNISLNEATKVEVVYESIENLSGIHNNATFGGSSFEVIQKTQPVLELK